MHDLKVLEQFNCTSKRLREIFTAKAEGSTATQLTTSGVTEHTSPTLLQGDTEPSGEVANAAKTPKTDGEIRKRIEGRVRFRLLEGLRINCKEARPYQAVDIGWDAPPIHKTTLPLQLWAMGKINIEHLHKSLSAVCAPATLNKFIHKNDRDELMVDVPRICEVSVNLLRSYVTRRHAAMDALWSNLWPLLRYDPRGSDQVAQLRGDALTQRVDIMADEYNYRHFQSQCRRDMLLYAKSVAFVRAAWDRQVGWRSKPTNTGEPGTEKESYVTREGVDFVNPHPSRIFYDLSAPLANVNTGTGPKYVGYWDVVRYQTILDGNYFNTDGIAASSGFMQLVQQYYDFFSYYFDPCVLTWPNWPTSGDPSLANDRLANIGAYTAELKDSGVLFTQYFEEINPKHEGICDYDCNIWLHLTVASDGTVIGAEFMPSGPAAYGGINCNDNRVSNMSMAMELLSFQDQATNIVTTMIEELKRSFTQLWLFNKDFIEPKIMEQIQAQAKGEKWWMEPQVLIMSFSEKAELMSAAGGWDPSKVIAVIQPKVQNAIEGALKSLAQLLNLADRLIILSPNELGQPNPREVSSRETQEISTSVQSIYSFINEAPREQIAAMKKIIYESLMAHGTDRIQVPVVRRYTVKTIKAAGFELGPNVVADAKDKVPTMSTIIGSLKKLDYDYYFDTRDGAERPINPQSAQVLTQMLQMLLGIKPVAQQMGMNRIFEICNAIIRLSGAPYDLNLEVEDGESGKIPPEADQQTGQQMAQLSQQVQNLTIIVLAVAKAAGVQLPQGPSAGPGGGPPQPPAAPPGVPPPPPGAVLQNQ